MPCTVMNRQRTHRDIDLEKKLESNSERERVRERKREKEIRDTQAQRLVALCGRMEN